MIPLPKIDNEIHESFPLKMVSRWKPGFRSNIRVNQNIRINYTRRLKQFICLDGSELLKTNINDFDLPGKIILLGYLGPGEEDKHFTPLRLVNEEYKDNEPDTYGLVIIANEIRTILEHGK